VQNVEMKTSRLDISVMATNNPLGWSITPKIPTITRSKLVTGMMFVRYMLHARHHPLEAMPHTSVRA
jgi:hypothetical protein